MGDLRRRVRALEARGWDYPECILQEAMRRIPTGELRKIVTVLGRVVNVGFPEKEAESVVLHISRLCEEIEKKRRREY